MKLKHKPLKKIRQITFKIQIPHLRLRYRLLLYLATIICIVLALVNVALECFPEAAGIVFYALAACTLAASSYYLAVNIKSGIKYKIKPAVYANPYAKRIVTEYRLRTVLFTVPGALGNILFAIFNGVVGIISHSPWFGTLAAYYILLSLMRVGAVNKERKILRIKDMEKRRKEENAVYRKNSILFVIMSFVLGGAVILLESSVGGKSYPGFTIYAAAAYAFYKIIMSTINVFKVRKQNSQLLTIIRRIGYIDGCVSILILQTAMFASFGDGREAFIKLMNGITGAAVCLIVLFIGIQGIYVSQKIKKEQEVTNSG